MVKQTHLTQVCLNLPWAAFDPFLLVVGHFTWNKMAVEQRNKPGESRAALVETERDGVPGSTLFKVARGISMGHLGLSTKSVTE